MSLPAVIGVATSVVNVALGVGALLLGWGIVGLALAAAVSTVLTAAVLWRVLGRDFPAAHATGAGFPRVERAVAMPLLRAGWPLMLNALLVGLFFRVDQFIIQPVLGSTAVAQYGAAYSFLNFVLLITPAVTFALFPRMSRHAQTDRPRLAYEYAFALKLLLITSVPIVALTVWFAPLLITIVTGGKPGYLPASAVALQILIFFLPFSFINGVTQYVLIALDRQRLITWAFAATVVFNVAANLVLIPWLGINGAALTTILSELVLLGPFLVWTGREIGRVPVGEMSIKPILGAGALLLLGWLMLPLLQNWSNGWGNFALYLAAGTALLAVYGAAMLLLRPFSEAETRVLRGALKRG